MATEKKYKKWEWDVEKFEMNWIANCYAVSYSDAMTLPWYL